jgi:hypothetical protein
MYRLVGFATQEQELYELVETEERRRALAAMIKAVREVAHDQYPDRAAGHAFYAQALADVRLALLSRGQSGDGVGLPSL